MLGLGVASESHVAVFPDAFDCFMRRSLTSFAKLGRGNVVISYIEMS